MTTKDPALVKKRSEGGVARERQPAARSIPLRLWC